MADPEQEQQAEGPQHGKSPDSSRPYHRYRRRRYNQHPKQKPQQQSSQDDAELVQSDQGDAATSGHSAQAQSRPEGEQSQGQAQQDENRQRGQSHRQEHQQRQRHGQNQGAQGHQGQGRKPDLSIVIPLYNEAESIPDLARQLRDALQRVGGNYEVLFIDDGSTDNSYQALRDLHFQNRRMKVIRFRRNFGKSAALAVGFAQASGAIVVTMDADLQDDPSEIPNLVRKIRDGYDLVSGWKKKRYDPITKTIPSRFFNFVTSTMTGFKLHDFNCGLKAYRSEVVKEVEVYGELHRFIPALAHWRGFRVGEIPVQHHRRRFGKTKFGPGRFFKGFLDLLTVLFTTRYIRRPLHFFGGWGTFSFIVGFAVDLWLTIEKIFNSVALSNRPIFFLGILLMIVGVQLISIGLLGEMISKGQQGREGYSIRETLL